MHISSVFAAAFASEHGLEVLDYANGEIGAPPRAVRQRLLARRA